MASHLLGLPGIGMLAQGQDPTPEVDIPGPFENLILSFTVLGLFTILWLFLSLRKDENTRGFRLINLVPALSFTFLGWYLARYQIVQYFWSDLTGEPDVARLFSPVVATVWVILYMLAFITVSRGILTAMTRLGLISALLYGYYVAYTDAFRPIDNWLVNLL